MDAFTLIVACVIVAIILGLVGLAYYSTGQSSFEDALPGYAASTPRASSKTNRKKRTAKHQTTEQKSTAEGVDRRQPHGKDGGRETETESDDEDSEDQTGRMSTRRKQKKQSNKQQLVPDEDMDLLSYSKNFKADTKKKITASLQAQSAKKPSRASDTTKAGTHTASPTAPSPAAASVKHSPMTSAAAGAASQKAGSSAGGRTVAENNAVATSRQSPAKVISANDELPPQVRDVIRTTSTWNNDVVRKLVKSLGARLGGSDGQDDWELKTARGDPVSVLKKQLDEKEQALKGALSQVQSLTTRYNESRAELSAARDRNTSLEQQCQQIQKSLSAENDALKKRMQHSHDEHVTALRSMPTTVSASHTISEKPDEEMQRKLKIMDDALKQNVLLLNSSVNAQKTLESKLKQNEEHTKNLEQQLKKEEEAHAKKVEALSDDLLKLEARNRSLLHDLEETKKTKTVDQTQQLQEKETLVSDLKSKLREVEGQRDDLQKVVERKTAELEEKAHSSNDVKQSEMLGQLNELEQTRDKLQSEVEHYKNILSETEQLLKELQDKTEAVELDWKQKLEAATSKLETTENEVKHLREEIDKVRNNNEPAVNGSASSQELEQLREKLSDTERRLEEERSSNKNLFDKLNEQNANQHQEHAVE